LRIADGGAQFTAQQRHARERRIGLGEPRLQFVRAARLALSRGKAAE